MATVRLFGNVLAYNGEDRSLKLLDDKSNTYTVYFVYKNQEWHVTDVESPKTGWKTSSTIVPVTYEFYNRSPQEFKSDVLRLVESMKPSCVCR
jgi:hypothetical protein